MLQVFSSCFVGSFWVQDEALLLCRMLVLNRLRLLEFGSKRIVTTRLRVQGIQMMPCAMSLRFERGECQQTSPASWSTTSECESPVPSTGLPAWPPHLQLQVLQKLSQLSCPHGCPPGLNLSDPVPGFQQGLGREPNNPCVALNVAPSCASVNNDHAGFMTAGNPGHDNSVETMPHMFDASTCNMAMQKRINKETRGLVLLFFCCSDFLAVRPDHSRPGPRLAPPLPAVYICMRNEREPLRTQASKLPMVGG